MTTELPGFDTLTVGEVSASLRVDAHTVQRWLRLGWMAGVRTPGGDWRIPRGEVEKMLTTTGD